MREEIARLDMSRERAIEHEQATSIRANQLEARLRQWARAINSQLGPEHPLNERIYEMTAQRAPRVNELTRFAERPRLSLCEVMDRSLSDITVSIAYVEAVTHLVELEPERFGFSVRALLQSRDGSTAYLIDRQVLRDGRRDPRFVEWVSKEIARKLSRQLAEAA
jgi:hypothetical protein